MKLRRAFVRFLPTDPGYMPFGLRWLRGLNASAANGGIGTLPTPLSPNNVGKPPAFPVNSGSNRTVTLDAAGTKYFRLIK